MESLRRFTSFRISSITSSSVSTSPSPWARFSIARFCSLEFMNRKTSRRSRSPDFIAAFISSLICSRSAILNEAEFFLLRHLFLFVGLEDGRELALAAGNRAAAKTALAGLDDRAAAADLLREAE